MSYFSWNLYLQMGAIISLITVTWFVKKVGTKPIFGNYRTIIGLVIVLFAVAVTWPLWAGLYGTEFCLWLRKKLKNPEQYRPTPAK